MAIRDSAFHVRDLVRRQAQRRTLRTGDELVPLAVAAVIAYGRLVGDATDVRNTMLLQERLERIALALSAVAKLHEGETGENPRIRKSDLPAAIETLRRAGVAFTD